MVMWQHSPEHDGVDVVELGGLVYTHEEDEVAYALALHWYHSPELSQLASYTPLHAALDPHAVSAAALNGYAVWEALLDAQCFRASL
jgi:hypothetical protein